MGKASDSTKRIGQRQTPQREFIYNLIKDAPGPLSVNEIREFANQGDKKIAIATIYRTVKLLLEKEEINSVSLPDGQVRYEIPNSEHRHHFHCRVCDKVTEIDHCCLHLHREEVNGNLVEHHEITLMGVCKACR